LHTSRGKGICASAEAMEASGGRQSLFTSWPKGSQIPLTTGTAAPARLATCHLGPPRSYSTPATAKHNLQRLCGDHCYHLSLTDDKKLRELK